MLITLLQLLYSIFRHNGKRWKNIDHGVMISQRFYDLLNILFGQTNKMHTVRVRSRKYVAWIIGYLTVVSFKYERERKKRRESNVFIVHNNTLKTKSLISLNYKQSKHLIRCAIYRMQFIRNWNTWNREYCVHSQRRLIFLEFSCQLPQPHNQVDICSAVSIEYLKIDRLFKWAVGTVNIHRIHVGCDNSFE